nr:MAG TPA: hypothetical protein [Caudoviricetes sp.]
MFENVIPFLSPILKISATCFKSFCRSANIIFHNFITRICMMIASNDKSSVDDRSVNGSHNYKTLSYFNLICGIVE